MHILLATGIYPPDIGGPATYAKHLAEELQKKGYEVTVVTYGRQVTSDKWKVESVSLRGNVLSRWMRYAKALRRYGETADVVIALSSVSVGVPLLIARLKKPRKILRLGGDFFWERYTDGGGTLGLAEWYRSRLGFWRLVNMLFMHRILSSFHTIVYSTQFQKQIHERAYKRLPHVCVIENAVPTSVRHEHRVHDPLRLLFVGRLVRFKRLSVLVDAVFAMPDAVLTITGHGPDLKNLEEQVRQLGLGERVTFMPPLFDHAKVKLFTEHDLLVIPSVTEISPNVALEAVSTGLPVLLTSDNGLSTPLHAGMLCAPLGSKMETLAAIMKARSQYESLCTAALSQRSWDTVTGEWISLLSSQ